MLHGSRIGLIMTLQLANECDASVRENLEFLQIVRNFISICKLAASFIFLDQISNFAPQHVLNGFTLTVNSK